MFENGMMSKKLADISTDISPRWGEGRLQQYEREFPSIPTMFENGMMSKKLGRYFSPIFRPDGAKDITKIGERI
jgi:hypothetical protein